MRLGDLVKTLAALIALWLACLAAPATAAAVPCHASARLNEPVSAIAAQPRRWTCANADWNYKAEATLIRFSVTGGDRPRSFVSRIGRFSTIALTAIDADGTERTRTYTMAEAATTGAGPYFHLPLPELTAQTRQIVARIERPWVNNILAEAHLSAATQGDGWRTDALLAAAAICGLLLAPLLFNLAFFWALGERFVLWHSGIVIGMLVQAMISSGLIHSLLHVPLGLTVALMSISFTVAVSAAALFTADIVEPDKLSVRTRWLLRWSAWPNLVIGMVCSLTIAPMREIAMPIYYLSLLPMIALFVWVMAEAWLRGSRMILFQIVGWTPSLVVGVYRIVSNVGATPSPSDAMLAYNASVAFEVLVTALGVANRFLAIRRERDIAHVLATQLRGEAEHDALTGLFNRRGIEPKFTQLRAAGFNVIAVIDLDHFKLINDTLGHQTGDQVLAATALALQPDEDTLAIRMGGEEFLLMLRGSNAPARAEARRRAITQRVSSLIAELPSPVTASMGLVEFPGDGLTELSFQQAYRWADALLYEAKRTGRNRTVSERMTVFERRSSKRVSAG